MAVIFKDTFTVAVNVDLVSHAPDTGTAWAEEEDTAVTFIEAEATPDSAGPDSAGASSHIYYSCTPAPSVVDYDVEMKITVIAAGTDDPAFMLGRFVDVDNFYSAGTYQGGAAADKKIFKEVGGTVTELASGDFDLTANDILKFEIRDATKKLYQNGTERLSTTDNAITSAGKAGLGFGNIWGVAADDVSNGWEVDDFTVTEVAAAAGHPAGRRVGAVPGMRGGGPSFGGGFTP